MRKWTESEKFPQRIELYIAIVMGITAVLTAFASWQSSLYGGSQSEKYTNGSAIITEANSMYNEASQLIAQDMNIWNRLTDLQIDMAMADENGDTAEVAKAEFKISKLMTDNVSDQLQEGIDWADAQEEYASPFDMEGFLDGYFTDAAARYEEGEAMIAACSLDNSLGDRQGLVTVIFSVVLFILGIANTFKENRTNLILVGISTLSFVMATVMMFSVPLIGL